MLVAMLATDQRSANARSSHTQGSTSPLVGAASARASYARSALAAARPADASSSQPLPGPAAPAFRDSADQQSAWRGVPCTRLRQ